MLMDQSSAWVLALFVSFYQIPATHWLSQTWLRWNSPMSVAFSYFSVKKYTCTNVYPMQVFCTWSPIEAITATSIRTIDGKHEDFDVIACATWGTISMFVRLKPLMGPHKQRFQKHVCSSLSSRGTEWRNPCGEMERICAALLDSRHWRYSQLVR